MYHDHCQVHADSFPGHPPIGVTAQLSSLRLLQRPQQVQSRHTVQVGSVEVEVKLEVIRDIGQEER